MKNEIKLQLLGNIAVRSGVENRHVRSKLVQGCLALLALEAGKPVRSSTLMGELWGDNQPREPKNALHAAITRSRSFMKRSDWSPEHLKTVPGGYLLDVERGQVDALAFRSAAEEILWDPDVDIQRCIEVLDMWNGPALMGISDGGRCLSEATLLEELRRQVSERLAIQRIKNRDYARAAHEIGQLTVERPLNENYRELRMIALYYLGQSASALAELNRFSDTMDREMGMAPSQRVRDLYFDILTDAKDRVDNRLSGYESAGPKRRTSSTENRTLRPHLQ